MKQRPWMTVDKSRNDKSLDTAGDTLAVTLIYDGECPFCRNYARLLKLKETVGSLTLLNAREVNETVSQVAHKGYDLDQGMVAIINGEIFHAEASLNRLALLSTKSNFFNKINNLIFKHKALSKLLYPLLRCGRNLTLKILGIKKIRIEPSQN